MLLNTVLKNQFTGTDMADEGGGKITLRLILFMALRYDQRDIPVTDSDIMTAWGLIQRITGGTEHVTLNIEEKAFIKKRLFLVYRDPTISGQVAEMLENDGKAQPMAPEIEK